MRATTTGTHRLSSGWTRDYSQVDTPLVRESSKQKNDGKKRDLGRTRFLAGRRVGLLCGGEHGRANAEYKRLDWRAYPYGVERGRREVWITASKTAFGTRSGRSHGVGKPLAQRESGVQRPVLGGTGRRMGGAQSGQGGFKKAKIQVDNGVGETTTKTNS